MPGPTQTEAWTEVSILIVPTAPRSAAATEQKAGQMKIYPYPSESAEKKLASIVNRGLTFRKKDQQAVTRILEDVRRHGDEALIRYTRQFDAPGLTIEQLRTSLEEIKEAGKSVDRAFRRALNRAAAQIEAFHRRQLPQSWIVSDRPGTLLGQMVHPVKRAGIYVDLLSGEPLFSSTNKFVSGTGWPSFTIPIDPDTIVYALDTRFGTERIETRSRFGDAHLGHVFEDGPEPLGLRYCMNSAALEFVPREEMEERGYAQFLVLFD